jgi:hypothetical protein
MVSASTRLRLCRVTARSPLTSPRFWLRAGWPAGLQVTLLAVVAAILLPIPWWIPISVLVLWWILTSAGLLTFAHRRQRLGRVTARPLKQLARQWSQLAWMNTTAGVLVSVMALVVFPLRVALVICVFMACAVFSTWRMARLVRRRLAGVQSQADGPN